jgi:hypothetical protein
MEILIQFDVLPAPGMVETRERRVGTREDKKEVLITSYLYFLFVGVGG